MSHLMTANPHTAKSTAEFFSSSLTAPATVTAASPGAAADTKGRPGSATSFPSVPPPGSSCDLSIVIPTYCEADNLVLLIPQIAAALDDAGITAEILIVDDNSPDKTQAVCEELALLYPIKLLVRREERGLSTAVIHGLRHAKGELLLVMDADLSHPPEKIPDLVAALRRGETDFVIGSRYVPGAGTDENWGLFRWLNSRVATLLARPLTAARDPMAGFFCLRRSTFENACRLDPVGYKIGLELIVKCGCRNIREVPIHFSDRVYGESKLSLKEQVNYLVHLKRLLAFKYETTLQAAQFACVGASGMVVDLVALTLLLAALPFSSARAVAIWIAMTWNFVLNRRLTFARSANAALLPQYVQFCGCCLAGGLINYGISRTLVQSVVPFTDHPLAAAVAGVLAGFAFNFALCRMWVFGRRQRKE